MGQYHVIYNKTKKEYFSWGGAKLWEKASSTVHSMGLLVLLCNSNNRGGGDLCNPISETTVDYSGPKLKRLKRPKYNLGYGRDARTVKKADYDAVQSALELVQGRWAGDEIVIQGDYAEESDPSYIPKDTFDDYTNITQLVVQMFDAVLKHETDEDSEKMKASIKFEKQIRGWK